MNYGSAEKCLRNSLRLPKQVSFIEKVEAYHTEPPDGAACRLLEIATLQCFEPSQPWIHSVCRETNYVSPYAASLSAMKIRFETFYHDGYSGFDVVHMQNAEIPSVQSRRVDQEDEEDWIGPIPLDDPTNLPNPAEADEPMLIFDEWEELRFLLADHLVEQFQQLHLVMYGLFQASVGNRQGVSRPDVESIRTNVMQAWQDFFLPGTTAFLHLVRPQEHLARNEIHLIVEFSNQVVVPPRVDVPILKRIVWHEPEESEPITAATYCTPGGNAFQTLLQLDLANWCYPWTRTVCNVHVEKRILPALDHARLQQGSLVEIFVHPDTIESDTFSTLQSDLWLRTPHPHVFDRCCGEVVTDCQRDTCHDYLVEQQNESQLVDLPPVGQWHRYGDLPEDYLELIAESDRHNGPQNLPRGPTTFEGEDHWIRIATLVNDRGDSPTWITLHGLYGEGVGSHRAVVTALSQSILERTIAERWPLLEHLVKRAFVVTPQPDDTAAHELTFLIEFIDPFDMPHESVRPVLEEIVAVNDEGHFDKQRSPLYLTAGSSFEDIVHGIPGCDPFHHGHRCDVWLGGVPVRLRDRPLILCGYLLAVRVLPLDSSPSNDVVLKFPGAHLFEQYAIAASARLPMSQLTWTIHKIERPGEVHRTVVLHPEWATAHSAQHLLQLIGQLNGLRVEEEGFHCAIVKHQPLDYENLHFVCGRQDPGHCMVLASFTQKWDELWQEHHSYQLPDRAGLLDIAGMLQLDAFNAWTLFLNGRPFDTVGTVVLNSGDVLDIEVDESSEEEDEMSALQWVRPSTSLNLKNAHRDHSDTDCSAVKCEMQELVQQWKPNPQIRTPFDEIIPDMHHTPAGPVTRGRIIPPLLWEENLEFRIALAAGACSRGVDGHLRVRIRSWIVRHGSPPEATCRDFTMRPQLFIHLRDTLRRIWRDRIVGNEAMAFHVVRPNPPVEPDGTRLLHVIVELNRPLECALQPMLLALRHITREGVADPTWCVGLFPPRFTTQDIHRTCNLQCEMHQLLVPLGGNIRRWMTPYMERQTIAGLFVPGWWDLRLRPTPVAPYEEDEETVTLMQRSASRTPRRPNVTPPSTDSAVTAVLAHAFHMSDEYRLVVLDQSAPLSYHQQFEAAWRAPTHVHLLNLHVVGNPPLDLEGTADITFLLEMSTDRNRQATPTDKLVLFDIVLVEASQTEPSNHFRRTVWLRRLMNRQAVLQFASAAFVCEVPEVGCELKINHQLWDEEDTAQRQILHGDFLRLQINGQSPQKVTDIQIALCEQESADIQKYIYRHSPPHSPSSPQDHGRSEASGSQARSPNSPNDEVTMMASGLPSNRQFVKGHPHVIDRWCDDLEQTAPSYGCGPSKEAPHQIKLDDCVTTSHCFAHFNCSDICKAHRCFSNLWLPPFLSRDDIETWHPSTEEGFSTLTNGPWEDFWPLEFSFYMDGGSKYEGDDHERRGAAAVVLIVSTTVGQHFGGIQARTVESPATAPYTEAWALLQAILWSISLLNAFPHAATANFTYHGDAMGPGAFSMGQWFPNVHTHIHDLCRNLVFWIEERTAQGCRWEHVKAHTGHPWNEAADTVATQVLDDKIGVPECSTLWQEITGFVNNPVAFGWIWFVERQLRNPDPLVMLTDHDLVITMPSKCPSTTFHDLDIVRQWSEQEHVPGSWLPVAVRFASMNVLSLFAGKDNQITAGGYPSARMEEIAHQCAQAGIDIVGIQESRNRNDHYYEINEYHVLSGAATAAGHGGVQLWIAKRWQGGLEVTHDNIRVIYNSSRLLLATIRTSSVKIGVASIHCPNAIGDEELTDWWKEVDLGFRAFGNLPVFVMVDSNSRVGSITSTSIGDHYANPENLPGQHFHEWLRRQHLWLPATFSECHSGESHTWVHPTGSSARIDYVAVPWNVEHSQVSSWISEDIDISVSRVDHMATCVEVTLSIPSGDTARRSREKEEGQTYFPNELQMPCVPWNVDIHHHANHLESALRNFQCHGKKRVATPRKAHLRDSTWNLVLAKKQCWKQLRRLGRLQRAGSLYTVFMSWKHGRSYVPTQGKDENPFCHSGIDKDIAITTVLHRHLARSSSKAVRQDDIDYYHELAERAGRTDSEAGLQGLWKEIKAVLPRQQSKRKANTRCRQPPIHALMRHFTELEAGEDAQFSTLASRCNSDQQERARVVMSIDDPATLPDRLSIERLCMKVQANKAPGLDKISPKVVKDNAGTVAKALGDLFFKMWVLQAEPIMWKGGQLFPLWKGAGSWNDPTKYRGIVLLNVLSKRWHALLRKKILPYAEAQRLPSQFGGFPMQQPGFATSTVRSFANICKAHNLCDACIYFDLRSAFHHLLRQLAMDLPDPTMPLPLQQVLEQDGFSLPSLEHRIADMNQLGRLPLPKQLNQLVADLHQFTWFSIKGASGPVWTHRGTRPGSPYFDGLWVC